MVNEGAEYNQYINDAHKPIYALEHLATFKLKNESEIKEPKEKMKLLVELDKTGGIWPQKMYMCFNGQWLVILDNDMKEIENFPGAMITEPTAFISNDPLEKFNNLLLFTVLGISLGNTEMHMFQVLDVSAMNLVEDLKQLSTGQPIIVDHNSCPIKLLKPEQPLTSSRDHIGVLTEQQNGHNQEQIERDILVLNHCFEDIERFVARLQYAAEALHELELRKNEHNPHGEGLLISRSRPPIASEFSDIFSKTKLAFNYIVKLQNHLNSAINSIQNVFISLKTVVNISNDVYSNANIPSGVVNPLLTRETVTFLRCGLNVEDIEFWQSLGSYWTLPKDQFKDHRGTYHPIFYDDWSPDWIVDDEVTYLPPTIKKNTVTSSAKNNIWLIRLQSRNVKIAEVKFNKCARNDKELNVTKGEYLEIIDNSRNWWKARNSAGNIGYVPNTLLVPYNFQYNGIQEKHDIDTDSIAMSSFGTDQNSLVNYNEGEMQRNMPNVPIPPPMPPIENQPTNETNSLKREVAFAARNDSDQSNSAYILLDSVTNELRHTLQQRQKRRDLEILKTPEIYINQNSSASDVQDWLLGKGFTDAVIKKLSNLNGEEIFALSPHTIEGYFGQKESRRLISQIVLQKNFCDYKTIRSSELSVKLARARRKADQSNNNISSDEIF